MDERALKNLEENGYSAARLLPGTGEVAALFEFIFTTGLIVGIDEFHYARRYCYERRMDAAAALAAWDGIGDPPGLWIVEKPSGRQGPGSDRKAREMPAMKCRPLPQIPCLVPVGCIGGEPVYFAHDPERVDRTERAITDLDW